MQIIVDIGPGYAGERIDWVFSHLILSAKAGQARLHFESPVLCSIPFPTPLRVFSRHKISCARRDNWWRDIWQVLAVLWVFDGAPRAQNEGYL